MRPLSPLFTLSLKQTVYVRGGGTLHCGSTTIQYVSRKLSLRSTVPLAGSSGPILPISYRDRQFGCPDPLLVLYQLGDFGLDKTLERHHFCLCRRGEFHEVFAIVQTSANLETEFT